MSTWVMVPAKGAVRRARSRVAWAASMRTCAAAISSAFGPSLIRSHSCFGGEQFGLGLVQLRIDLFHVQRIGQLLHVAQVVFGLLLFLARAGILAQPGGVDRVFSPAPLVWL